LCADAAPWLQIDGEMMADTAVTPELLAEYPFSTLKQPANVLIAPSLEAGNIAYKLLMRLGGAEAVGPIMLGFSKPVAVLQRGADVNEIVHMAALAVVEAQATRAGARGRSSLGVRLDLSGNPRRRAGPQGRGPVALVERGEQRQLGDGVSLGFVQGPLVGLLPLREGAFGNGDLERANQVLRSGETWKTCSRAPASSR
jgi:hypothetical protein